MIINLSLQEWQTGPYCKTPAGLTTFHGYLSDLNAMDRKSQVLLILFFEHCPWCRRHSTMGMLQKILTGYLTRA